MFWICPFPEHSFSEPKVGIFKNLIFQLQVLFLILCQRKNCVPAENCTGYYQAIAYDLDCIQKHPTVCQVLRFLLLNCFWNKKSKQERYLWSQDIVSQFWLRGLCSSSTLDTVYKLRQDLSQVIINHHEMLHSECPKIREDVNLEVHQDGSFIGLGLYLTDHITVKKIISEFFSTNHYTIRSKWVVENSRFAGVGAEVIQRSNLFFWKL